MFKNGDCFFSTVGDTSSIWPSISTYTPEWLNLNGWVVSSVITQPSLYVSVTDNNYAGTYTYTFTYTDYLGSVFNVQKLFTFVQTACKDGVTGFSLPASYKLNILDTMPISIDISTVKNKNCRYRFTLELISGISTQTFMSLTQPTFGLEASFVWPTLTQGTLDINALTDTTVQKQ